MKRTTETILDAPKKQSAPNSHKRVKIAMIVLACVVLLVGIISLVYFATKKNDVHYKNSYTVSDRKAQKAADTVIATLADRELTNAQLQICYYRVIKEYLDYYGAYIIYTGLDVSKPLDSQWFDEAEGTTWQQYFLELALDEWRTTQVLRIKADAANYQISDDLAKYLETMVTDLETSAKKNGFDSAAAMVKSDMGVSCSLDEYVEYMTAYYIGREYYVQVCNSFEPADEEILAFFTQHEAEYAENKLLKEDVSVDVRHILIYADTNGPEEDGYPTPTEEDWENCRKEAQALMDQWLKDGASESTFANMANQYSEDKDTNTIGGLYEDIYDGQYPDGFNDWCFDSIRQGGDYGLVKSSYGYHLMYFVSSSPRWYDVARKDLITESINIWLNEAKIEQPMETVYRKIVLTEIVF